MRATTAQRAVGALDGRPVDERRPLTARDWRWLTLAVVPAAVAVGVYLLTNPYPAYGAGLYTQIATEIAGHGYAPPVRVPGYTADGVPFAYPPLQFYVLAVLLDLGADPVVLARFLPAPAVIAASVPVYLLGRDLTGSRPAGAGAGAFVGVNPQVLEWHVSAGGVVRAYAFLYALVAVYVGYHVFASGRRRWTAAGVVAVGLTGLSHPTYALFAVATYVLFWALLDRSVAGFARGMVVGLGAGVLVAPWALWVASTHGPTAFLAAAGTHGGIGGGAGTLLGGLSIYEAVPLATAAYLLLRREWLLPAWVLLATVLFMQPRFAFTVGAFALAAVALDVARRLPPTGRALGTCDGRRALATALLVATALVGGLYLAHEMTLVTDPTSPEFIDEADVAAMEWAATETGDDARFVVLGDAAEWFPALSGRTVLIGPWGVEWSDSAAYYRHLEAYTAMSACETADCVESTATRVGADPDYVYVPKGQYTIRGTHAVQFGTLERSFEESGRWERAYENEGVVVYRVAPAETDDRDSQHAGRRYLVIADPPVPAGTSR